MTPPKIKIGQRVKIVRSTNPYTNHSGLEIGDEFIVGFVERNTNKDHKKEYKVDYYIGPSPDRCLSNRDVKRVKINWKEHYKPKVRVGAKVRSLNPNNIDYGYKVGEVYTLKINYYKDYWSTNEIPLYGIKDTDFEVVG